MNRCLALSILVVLAFTAAASAAAGASDPVDCVDPMIGTGGHGHTFPGPALPFGMVQLSPDTRLTGWDGCSGYHDSDRRVFGFSHTHLSGTGVSDYGDILLLPATGKIRWISGYAPEDSARGYGSRFRKADERASAGYYAVHLDDYGVTAELTATLRAGMHRYTFERGGPAHILLDLSHRDEVIESSLRVVGPQEIEGFRRSRAWARNQRVYFVARFSRPVDALIAVDDRPREGLTFAEGTNVKAALRFTAKRGEAVLVKVGISAVDIDGARRNLDEEIPGWGFEAVHQAARLAWEEALGRITVRGGTLEQETAFYTALYHALLQPNTWSDTDGRYRGRDDAIHMAEGRTQYTVFSLWDTFRAAHPLYTILEPARTTDFIETFLAQRREGGRLPVWELAANETDCMIGYHAVSVIADAYAKGIRGFDAEAAFEAMRASAEEDARGLAAYRKYGYIPADKESESVSKTLEYAYDDWCIARMAEALGNEFERAKFDRRAASWRSLLDPATGFMRPKRNAAWLAPFRPTEVDFNFTEANSWQYTFFVPQDISGEMEALGGPAAYAAKLDSLFAASPQTTGREQSDITGLIGQYAHGNEPSHHMAYLYAYAGQPWKTQERVREIMDTMYAARPDGLIGNEDCGQMSAWYVLSALGFYSVCPGRAGVHDRHAALPRRRPSSTQRCRVHHRSRRRGAWTPLHPVGNSERRAVRARLDHPRGDPRRRTPRLRDGRGTEPRLGRRTGEDAGFEHGRRASGSRPLRDERGDAVSRQHASCARLTGRRRRHPLHTGRSRADALLAGLQGTDHVDRHDQGVLPKRCRRRGVRALAGSGVPSHPRPSARHESLPHPPPVHRQRSRRPHRRCARGRGLAPRRVARLLRHRHGSGRGSRRDDPRHAARDEFLAGPELVDLHAALRVVRCFDGRRRMGARGKRGQWRR